MFEAIVYTLLIILALATYSEVKKIQEKLAGPKNVEKAYYEWGKADYLSGVKPFYDGSDYAEDEFCRAYIDGYRTTKMEQM